MEHVRLIASFAQVSYLHSDTQNAAWTVMPEEEVGKDIGPLIQNGYQHPKAVKAIVPGTVFYVIRDSRTGKRP